MTFKTISMIKIKKQLKTWLKLENAYFKSVDVSMVCHGWVVSQLP